MFVWKTRRIRESEEVEAGVTAAGRSSSGHLLDEAAARSGHCFDTCLARAKDCSRINMP